MRARRALVAGVTAALLLAACGDDSPTATVTSGASSSAASSSASSSSSSTPASVEQPAIWPAADVVFDTPEAAAADFVTKVLQVPPALGPFEQGDSRSGEIQLLSPGEGGAAKPRGVLLLRQLGPHNGWFLIGVANTNASIESPASGAEVPAAPLTVQGKARGFEANVVVRAFVAGHADQQLDQQITSGGAFETPEPYSVTLGLSGARPGQVVTILVRGGTGLETDPGEVGAIPVVIAGP